MHPELGAEDRLVELERQLVLPLRTVERQIASGQRALGDDRRLGIADRDVDRAQRLVGLGPPPQPPRRRGEPKAGDPAAGPHRNMRPQEQVTATAEPAGDDLAVARVAKRALRAMHPGESLAAVELVDLVHAAMQLLALRLAFAAYSLGPPHEGVVGPRRSLGRAPLRVPA